MAEQEESESDRRFNNLIAISIAFVATFMALSAIKSGNLDKAISQTQAERIDNWAWYQAVRVREDMGLVNVKAMIPFCRTVEEGRRVIELMAGYGLKQGEHDLEIYAMCELPANVIYADEFLRVFDGYSIGSNDLTQLTLGLDRDSEMVAHLFDERDGAVERMVTLAIEAAQRAGKKIGICGQAPSDYPEFAEFLVQKGISSISLNPDTVVQTTHKILEVENSLVTKSKKLTEPSLITNTVIDSDVVQTIDGPEQ